MREFIQTWALRRDASHAFPVLRRMVRNWFNRRALVKLEQCDDFMLRDIGLSRADLRLVSAMPLDIDPIPELDRRRARAARRLR